MHMSSGNDIKYKILYIYIYIYIYMLQKPATAVSLLQHLIIRKLRYFLI